ncbi:MAG TPA: RNA polymerase sigma-70 factor [Agriterribacter sp.]|nr:RNA polymerase sigma-70 factor [Agriterribacter sp.]HRQ49622.1 RNA polymerase sigma-70 factor [Agriterribacter sp.]
MLTHTIYTETELFDMLSGGDKEAFTRVYLLYAPDLIGFAAARVSSVETAQDIVHDLFTHLWDNRATIRIRESLKGYLFAAVRYRIVDHIRKNVTRREYAVMLEQLADKLVASEEAAIVSKNLQDTLEQSIEDLPSRTRQIYRMSRNHHLAVKEIASKLGLSEQTVKNQLSVALHHLRHSWEKLAILLLLFPS